MSGLSDWCTPVPWSLGYDGGTETRRTGERTPEPFVVCPVCRGAATPGHQRCWSCHVVRAELGAELVRVVPVSLFVPGSALGHLLAGYKAAPTDRSRAAQRALLATLLASFLRGHLSCVLSGDQSDRASALGPSAGRRIYQGDTARPAVLVVPVPSSAAGRQSWQGTHPLVGLLAEALGRAWPPTYEPPCRLAPLLERGPRAIGHLRAHRRGFVATAAANGAVAIVLDDTYTSGARAQSAASALSDAGAVVAGIVAIGRLLRPDHNAATAGLWTRQRAESFDARRCAGPCRLPEVPRAGSGPSRQQQRPEAA